jgi:hypothetical protein
MWFRVECEHKINKGTRHVDINAHNEKEALSYGRIYYPEDQYTGHKLVPIPEKEESGAARQK